MGSIIFVTGTGTGVGKTVLTALLVRFLRQHGRLALAMKPFCSGAPDDVEILWNAQERAISKKEINPFYYNQPLAPLVAGRALGRSVSLPEALASVRALAERCEILLIEGAGGLLVPLGEGYTIADLIQALNCPVIVAARNELGTVNHTLLTTRVLRTLGVSDIRAVLVDAARPDPSTPANAQLIEEFGGGPVVCLPRLSSELRTADAIEEGAKNLKKPLAQILRIDTFSSAFRQSGAGRGEKKGLEEKSKKSSC